MQRCLSASLLLPVALVTIAPATGLAVEGQTTVETVIGGLKHPTGLAVRPGGSRSGPDLLIAETGAGRVMGLSTDQQTSELVAVLTGFDKGGGAGPGCIIFRSRNRLLVGQSASDLHPAVVSEYDIDDNQLPMARSERKSRFDYDQGDEDVTLAGIARGDSNLVVSTAEHQWLLQAKLQTSPAGKLEPFVMPLKATDVGSPKAVTFSEKGYLVVSLTGEHDAGGDSLIVFLHPVDITAAPLLVLKTGLHEIVALAYSPTSGNLYVATRGEGQSRSGIYRIVATSGPDASNCEAQFVAELLQPTAMAFTADGTLYITTSGGEDKATGELLKLTGGL